ncbi:hypothetical protein ACFQUU_13495 [Herbaspirillum sp. GCM10030257]|uniref:hypothetical protein n=1 Tax=Herbaspirillum sp. GCM10030257 TaxID=3273393 RepID=UPI0036081412
MITRTYNWPALLLAFLFTTLTTALQAGPRDAPFRATLAVQETIAEDSSCPSGLGGTLTGSGTATHLGAVTISATHCATPGGRGSVAISRGVITFTAANNDFLTADFMGTISPFPGDLQTNTFVGSFLITGGTGRFTNAEGDGLLSGTFSGSLLTRIFTGTMTVDGRIGY